MSLTTYLVRGFEHRHENQMFADLVGALELEFGSTQEPHLLIGNVIVEGSELDALFLNTRGVCILEMKAHGGKVQFRENVPWTVGENEVRGGTKDNPFQQVRAYRMAVRNFFSAREREILVRARHIYWQHTCAMVLFGNPIEFDANVLGRSLSSWFRIADLPSVGDHLSKLNSDLLQLLPEELFKVPDILGLQQEHIYSTVSSVVPTASIEVANPPKRSSSRLKLIYLKDFGFREHELRLRNHGGARSQAAQRVRDLFEKIRQGLDPLEDLEKKPDSRIAGAIRYRVNATCQLLIIHTGESLYPAMVGTQEEVEGWIEAHRGLTIAIDSSSGRISVTTVTAANGGQDSRFDNPGLSSENRNLLAQIPTLQLEDYSLPKLARQHMERLDGESTEEEIVDALELIPDQDTRNLFFDLINLVRAGDLAAATTRLMLREGATVPVSDAGTFGSDAPDLPINSDQSIVVSDLSKEELDQLLDPEHFQDWMLFLHPDQKKWAEATLERPMILTGVSGSGKTCILVHRAKVLAQRYPGERVGVMTLSGPLAQLLQNLINRLCSEREREQIRVLPFYEHFKNCLAHLGIGKFVSQLQSELTDHSQMHQTLDRLLARWPRSMIWDCDPISKVRVEEEWEDFYMQHNPDVREWMNGITRHLEELRVDASRYLEEEFTLLRSSFPIPTRIKGYLEMARKGRSIPIREELRKDILRLIFFWEDWLLHGGMIDSLGLTLALLPLHQEMQHLPDHLKFRCLLVDEFQDLSSLDLQILRRIVPIGLPDSLFLAGDTVQRVLVKRLSLAEAGLERGPAAYASIKKNYRNSRQILRAAARLANYYGAIASSQGEEIEILDPELAQRETNPPVAVATDNAIEKAWELVLECLNADDRTERWTVSVVTAAPDKITIDAILSARPVNVAARQLTGNSIDRPEEVTVGSIKDLKGFEFRMVVIVGCSKELLPDPGVPGGEEWRDALRLYVAMTRGRDQVYLIYEGDPSPYIQVMGDFIVSREEGVRTPYLKVAESSGPTSRVASQGVVARLPQSISGRDPDTNCEDAFTATELEVLKKYYAQKVHRPNLTFREWCLPRNLARIRQGWLTSIRRVRPADAELLLDKLRRLGILGAEFGAPRVLPREGRCQASDCSHAPIPGEEYCYEHKSE